MSSCYSRKLSRSISIIPSLKTKSIVEVLNDYQWVQHKHFCVESSIYEFFVILEPIATNIKNCLLGLPERWLDDVPHGQDERDGGVALLTAGEALHVSLTNDVTTFGTDGDVQGVLLVVERKLANEVPGD